MLWKFGLAHVLPTRRRRSPGEGQRDREKGSKNLEHNKAWLLAESGGCGAELTNAEPQSVHSSFRFSFCSQVELESMDVSNSSSATVLMVNLDNGLTGSRSQELKWRRIESLERSISPVAHTLIRFSYAEILSATRSFSKGRVLGRGALSCVFRGRVGILRSAVAIKRLDKEDKESSKAFCRELMIASSLHNTYIVPLVGFCIDPEEGLFLVYKYVSGGSLERFLHEKKMGVKRGSTLSWSVRYKVAVGIAEAVGYLHNGTERCVVHRDIKPSNILLSSRRTPKLCDFGLATWTPAPSVPFLCKTIKGTFGYLAPEYFQHGKVYDKIDVYAFGLVLLELITGRKPIEAKRGPGEENFLLWENGVCFSYTVMQRRIVSEIPHLKALKWRFNPSFRFVAIKTLTSEVGEGEGEGGDDPLYADVPKPRRSKSDRKPYPTPMKILIRRAKEEREDRKAQPCRMLEDPPDNGLLVPELVDVAHRVYRAREYLLLGISKLVCLIPVQRCRYCFEVHIGYVGHEIRTCSGSRSGFRSATHVWRKGGVRDVIYFPNCFHLHDRVGRPRVGHDETHTVRRIPAIMELCIQAGLDLEKYPTRRRTKPVYYIEGRIVDFESQTEKDEMTRNLNAENFKSLEEFYSVTENENVGNNSNLDHLVNSQVLPNPEDGKSTRELSIVTLQSWFEMISGAKKMMEKYKVWTCGYCPQVQVGPKGHKVRMCKASKHQSRNGLHAWQEATVDELVGPNYVWHVRDLNGPPLVNGLKRYYGKAPAAVELCVHAGAPIPDQYRSMMRLDVVPPDHDEVDLVT